MKNIELIKPNWPAPSHVNAISTIRVGGLSQAPYDEFNLALHVNDHPEHVNANRKLLKSTLNLPHEPLWLKQIHSHIVVNAAENHLIDAINADATYSHQAGYVCVIMTADCLPILFCNREGTQIAAAHVGWRGLGAGVIENTLKTFSTAPSEILAWLGPAIGPENYEVGKDVYDYFIKQNKSSAQAFQTKENNKWLLDIYYLARQRLQAFGVTEIYGGGFCTFSDPQRFYSFRRDKVTGRMASLIWF